MVVFIGHVSPQCIIFYLSSHLLHETFTRQLREGERSNSNARDANKESVSYSMCEQYLFSGGLLNYIRHSIYMRIYTLRGFPSLWLIRIRVGHMH